MILCFTLLYSLGILARIVLVVDIEVSIFKFRPGGGLKFDLFLTTEMSVCS